MPREGRDYGYFWNSNRGDRRYDSEDFTRVFKKFFTNGVFANELHVTQIGQLEVEVAPGYALVEGHLKHFSEPTRLTLELPAEQASGKGVHLCAIVVECNFAERDMQIKAIPNYTQYLVTDTDGTTHGRRTSDVFDLILATCEVVRGYTPDPDGISRLGITDTRMNKGYCGYVTGTVEEVDFSQIPEQFSTWLTAFTNKAQNDWNNWTSEKQNGWDDWTSEKRSDIGRWFVEQRDAFNNWKNNQVVSFDEWFNMIKGRLDEDAAGHLENAKMDKPIGTKGQILGFLDNNVVGAMKPPKGTDDPIYLLNGGFIGSRIEPSYSHDSYTINHISNGQSMIVAKYPSGGVSKVIETGIVLKNDEIDENASFKPICGKCVRPDSSSSDGKFDIVYFLSKNYFEEEEGCKVVTAEIVDNIPRLGAEIIDIKVPQGKKIHPISIFFQGGEGKGLASDSTSTKVKYTVYATMRVESRENDVTIEINSSTYGFPTFLALGRNKALADAKMKVANAFLWGDRVKPTDSVDEETSAVTETYEIPLGNGYDPDALFPITMLGVDELLITAEGLTESVRPLESETDGWPKITVIYEEKDAQEGDD